MSQNKYFYIVDNDKQIFEIPYTEDRIAMAIKAWRSKEIFTVKGYGAIVGGAYIHKVLDSDQYENYINTVNPTRYIKNGTWFDGKERNVVSHEPWKLKELEEAKRIGEDQNRPQTPEEIERAKKVRAEVDAFLKGNVFSK